MTKLFLDLILGVPTWLLEQLPAVTLPAWVGSIVGYIGGFVGFLESMGNWIPVDHFGPAMSFVVLSVGVALAVKVVRIVASFLTAGGGSAA